MADDIVVIDIVLKVRTEEEDGETKSKEEIKEETPSTEPAPKEIPTSPIETESTPEPTLPKPEPPTPIATPAPEPERTPRGFLESDDFEKWRAKVEEHFNTMPPETKATLEQEIELLKKQVGHITSRKVESKSPVQSPPASPPPAPEPAPAAPEKEEVDPEKIAQLQEFIDQLDSKGIQTLTSFAKNPVGFTQSGVLGVLGRLGPHGAIIASIIGTIIATPELIKTLVKALAVKGAIFNQDFHRYLDEETQLGIDRDLQYRRAVGLDVVITTSHKGYLLSDPAHTTNNLVDFDSTVYDRLWSRETQYGYYA